MSRRQSTRDVTDETTPLVETLKKTSLQSSALQQYWRPFLVGSWLFYALFIVILHVSNANAEGPLCKDSADNYPSWYWNVCSAVMGGFVVILLVLLNKVFGVKEQYEKVPLYVGLHIVFKGAMSTALTLFFQWGGICVDALGVATPASVWPEWCANGPLIVFISLTIVDKPTLSRGDIFFMATFFVCLFAAFMILGATRETGIIWLLVSCVAYAPMLFLPWYTKRQTLFKKDLKHGLTEIYDEAAKEMMVARYEQQQNIVFWVSMILPLYSINYFAAYLNFIDQPTTVCSFLVLSVVLKGLIAGATMTAHLDLIQETEKRVLLQESKVNSARRAFMRYIFHEVRTPLSSLAIGIKYLQMSDSISLSDKEPLVMMEAACEFMTETLDGVLNMHRIEEGKLELELAPFNLSTAFTKVASMYRALLAQKKITLDVEVGKDVPELLIGDFHRIIHIISNLLSNAIKFSPEGESIELQGVLARTASFRESTAAVVISVTDHGPGISDANQALLFNNFVQIRPGKLQQGQGSGLGLSLVKQLVLLHGGKVSVRSTEGSGSTFECVIPFRVPEVDLGRDRFAEEAGLNIELQDVVESRNANDIRGGATKFTPLSQEMSVADPQVAPLCSGFVDLDILVVDDAPINLKLLVMFLNRQGLKSTEAKDGMEAVDIILQHDMHKHKMILLDNLMPRMTGLEAAATLRGAGYPYLIIGLTGNVMEDDISEYISAGADMVLSKPMNVAVFDQLIAMAKREGLVSKQGMRLAVSGNDGTLKWISKGKK